MISPMYSAMPKPSSVKFGARYLRDVPLTYVSDKAQGVVPAQVWEVEKKDMDRLMGILGSWNRVPLFSKTMVLMLPMKLKAMLDWPIVRPFVWAIKSIWNLFKSLTNRLFGTGSNPETKSDPNSTGILALTVGGKKVNGKRIGGKLVGIMHLSDTPTKTSINYVETPPWNRRTSDGPSLQGRFRGVLEGLLYTALASRTEKKLTWFPIGADVQRYYEILLKRQLKIAPDKGWLESSIEPPHVKALFAKTKAHYQTQKLDPDAFTAAKEALKSISEPAPLVQSGDDISR